MLTAYYMSRLEILAFGGEPRFDKPGPHGEPALHAPHESPWVMRLPLVVLAFFAFFGGVLDLPWVHTAQPVELPGPGVRRHASTTTIWERGRSGRSHWPTSRPRSSASSSRRGCGGAPRWTSPRLEPAFLQRVWYWDDFYDTIIGRPSQRLATFCAWVVDARVIDGAVNGTAHLAKVTGTAARKLQTGYARNYALGIALGMALIIAFMLSRTWWG